jgi:hypothetical protein
MTSIGPHATSLQPGGLAVGPEDSGGSEVRGEHPTRELAKAQTVNGREHQDDEPKPTEPRELL